MQLAGTQSILDLDMILSFHRMCPAAGSLPHGGVVLYHLFAVICLGSLSVSEWQLSSLTTLLSNLAYEYAPKRECKTALALGGCQGL